MERSAGIGALLRRMEGLLEPLEASGDPGRFFLATYLRTTRAVAEELGGAGSATRSGSSAGTSPSPTSTWTPWRTPRPAAARPSRGRSPSAGEPTACRPCARPARHERPHQLRPGPVAAGVISGRVRDPELLASRHADHEHIDQVLVARVGAEDTELEALGPRSRTDRLLQPLNRLATKRFLRESRAKVWANTRLLDAARRTGPDAYAARLAELERLAATRVADLMAPGQVVLKLAVKGFGVRLPDA